MTESQTTRACVEALFVDAPPLPEGGRVVVAVPDLTRPIDYEVVLSPLLAALFARGCDVLVMVALGLHRPMSEPELVTLRQVVSRYGFTLTQHDAHGELRRCGDEPPTFLPTAILDAGAVICVGTVEPHQYAGFSGGVKTIAIGCAGQKTISWMHGLALLREPGVGVGRLDGNPFQAALWRISERVPGTIYGMFVVPDGGPERAWGASLGLVESAFAEACALAAAHHFAELEHAVSWMHLKVPPSKASSFYQASRAATYVALVDRPALQVGGWLLIDAACPEGIGRGAGEEACAIAFRKGQELLTRELSGEVPATSTGGQQRAYVVAKALQTSNMAVIGGETMPELEAMGIRHFATVEDAIRELELKGDDGYVVENPFHRVPQLRT